MLSERHMMVVGTISTEIRNNSRSGKNNNLSGGNSNDNILSKAVAMAVEIGSAKLIDFFVDVLFRKESISRGISDSIVYQSIGKNKLGFDYMLNRLVETTDKYANMLVANMFQAIDKIPRFRVSARNVMPRAMECQDKYYFYRLENLWSYTDDRALPVDYFTLATRARNDPLEACKFALVLATSLYLQNSNLDYVLTGLHIGALLSAKKRNNEQCIKFINELFPRTQSYLEPDYNTDMFVKCESPDNRLKRGRDDR